MALRWPLNVKNCLENRFGLHIGSNPTLSSATRDGPPALEGIAKSRAFSLHLNAMHEAREAFIKAESSLALK